MGNEFYYNVMRITDVIVAWKMGFRSGCLLDQVPRVMWPMTATFSLRHVYMGGSICR